MIVLWLYELCAWIWPLIKVWQGREKTRKHLAKIFLCKINQPQFIHSFLKGQVFLSSKLPSPRVSLASLPLGWVNSGAQQRAGWRQHCVCPVSCVLFQHQVWCVLVFAMSYVSLISVTLGVLIAWSQLISSGAVRAVANPWHWHKLYFIHLPQPVFPCCWDRFDCVSLDCVYLDCVR